MNAQDNARNWTFEGEREREKKNTRRLVWTVNRSVNHAKLTGLPLISSSINIVHVLFCVCVVGCFSNCLGRRIRSYIWPVYVQFTSDNKVSPIFQNMHGFVVRLVCVWMCYFFSCWYLYTFELHNRPTYKLHICKLCLIIMHAQRPAAQYHEPLPFHIVYTLANYMAVLWEMRCTRERADKKHTRKRNRTSHRSKKKNAAEDLARTNVKTIYLINDEH